MADTLSGVPPTSSADGSTAHADPVASPDTIGGFEVRRVLGQGGMGRVYGCWDKDLEREVAVKVLLAELGAQPEMAQRFVREARAMAKISSPHVVVVHQVGEDTLGPFLVMELLEGEDLASRIRHAGAMSFHEVVGLALEALEGLKTASAAGLVHRDVKPENLFLTPAGVKLTDFGLARPLDGSANLTQAGLVVGSPHYLAPELARGADATVQSDLYALGATLFEMLTGKPPYTGGTPVEIITAHLTQPLPTVASSRPDVPRTLAALVEQMLAKEPAARPSTFDEVMGALSAIRAELPAPSSPLDAAAASPLTAPEASSSAPGAPAGGTQLLGSADGASASAGPADTAVLVAEGAAPSTSANSTTRPTASVSRLRASGALPSVKTDTLAVMFTDLAGYTARTGTQSREEAAYWLELHDALLKPVFRAFKGTVVKTIGDAFLVTFKSPTDAVHCGCAIQDRLFEHNQKATDDDRIDVRVAISVGEVRLRKGDVLGEPVNLAARLEGLADKGEVLFSDAVFATMNAAEVPADDRGEHDLKGIQRKVRVYAAHRAEAANVMPFGGQALQRVNDTGLEAALDGARRRLQGALGQVSEGIGEVARPPSAAGLKRLAMAGAALVALVLVVWGASAALTQLSRSPDDPISEWTIEELGKFLGDRDIPDIKAELKRRDPDDLVDDLEHLLEEGNWIARHNTLGLLEDVGSATDGHRTTVAIADLKAANTCRRKLQAIRRLQKVADRDEAVDAFDHADLVGCKVPEGTREAIETAVDTH